MAGAGSLFRGSSDGHSSRGAGSVFRSGSGGGSAPAKKTSGGGGVLGFLSRGASDLKNAAIGTPAGIYGLGKHAAQDVEGQTLNTIGSLFDLGHGGTVGNPVAGRVSTSHQTGRTAADVKAMGKQTLRSFEKPGEHPGYTFLNLLALASAGAGTAARVGAASRAVSEGAALGDVAKAALTKPVPPARLLTSGDATVEGVYPKAPLARGVVRAADKATATLAERNPAGRAAGRLHTQMSKVMTEQLRHTTNQANALPNLLQKLGGQLSPPEQMALKITAEGVNPEARIAGHGLNIAKGIGTEEAHRGKIGMIRGAQKHLTTDAKGFPVIDAAANPKLAYVYKLLQKVSTGREDLLAKLELLNPETAAGRKVAAGRAAMGEAVTAPPASGTPGALHLPGLEPPSTMSPAAADFKPPAHAVYVPDVALPPSRSAGKTPKVGAGGTVPIPKVQSNLTHQFTGALRAKGLERDDTTRLVADSALWANKHRSLVGLHNYAKKLATDHQLRKDDIPVRLDNAKPSERYPLAVKKFMADPESMAAATPAEQAKGWEAVKGSLFPEQWSLDPAKRAEFEKLSAEGKIGWVPRKALGNLAQQDPNLRSVLGKATSVVDAVNNAQRFAILYLKPAYAIPNLLGNVALNIVQQGFAAPVNLARAVRLSHRLSPEVVDQYRALMGEGLSHILGANQGIGSKVVEKAANFWQKGVDTPFRDAAFLHEARIRGFKTDAQITKLVTDEAHHSDLMQVTMHANREIIDYANLGPKEREIIRRTIFFYPWIKGSTAYAGHLVGSHPVGAGVGGAIGRQGYEQAQKDIGPVPSYLEGAFNVGGRIVNPTSAAVLQTPAQMGEVLANALTGNYTKAGQASGQLTPALQLLQALATHQDPFTGRTYPKGHGNAGQIARDQLVGGLPQVALLHALFPNSPLVGKLTGPRKPSKLYRDTKKDALGRFGVGGLWPRAYNKAYLNHLAAIEKAGR